jgi:UDP-3-O-[3-hydroxymyristoyl] glucosamine N-acyltransferase
VTDFDGGPRSDLTLSAGQVAELLGGRVEGDPSIRVRGIAPLNQAGPDEIGFLTARRYLPDLEGTEAGSLLVSESLVDATPGHASRIVVKDARKALPAVLAHFYPEVKPDPGIHPTAILGKGVDLGDRLTIGPYAVIGDGASLKDGVCIGAHAVVGEGCSIGEESVLHPHVVLYPKSVLGSRVVLHAGVRIGADGFGYVPTPKGPQKVPQVGACVIGDDVEIGANSCVDRGSIGRTEIGRNTKIDNLVQVAHNCLVGKGVIIVAQVGVGGSSVVGDGVMLGGQSGLSGHLEVGAGARVAAQAGVIKSVPAGQTVTGFPARENREFLRAMGNLYNFPDTLRRLKKLEDRLASMEKSDGG